MIKIICYETVDCVYKADMGNLRVFQNLFLAKTLKFFSFFVSYLFEVSSGHKRISDFERNRENICFAKIHAEWLKVWLKNGFGIKIVFVYFL